MGLVGRGKVAGGAADAGTDVEDMVGGLRVQKRCMIAGGVDFAAVELIKRVKLGGLQRDR